MRGMRKILPVFTEQGSGVIVNLASIADLTGGRAGLTYTAAKHAVAGMTKNVGSHYGAQGVRCNAIAPVQVETGITQSIDGYDMFGLQQSTRGVKGLMNRAYRFHHSMGLPFNLFQSAINSWLPLFSIIPASYAYKPLPLAGQMDPPQVNTRSSHMPS